MLRAAAEPLSAAHRLLLRTPRCALRPQVLWLNNNRLAKLTGLQHNWRLRELYLQNNQITKIEGLETLGNLTKLCAPRTAPLPAGRGSVALPSRPSIARG